MKKDILLQKICNVFKGKEKLMKLTHKELVEIFRKFTKKDLEEIYSDELLELHTFQCDYDYAKGSGEKAYETS